MFLLSIENFLKLHIFVGWIGIILGVLSGAIMGMLFHKEKWLGGYDSVPRRMIRLGHISFFGMSFLNFALAITLLLVNEASNLTLLATLGMLVATITMPTICFVSAFKGISRVMFTLPVTATVVMMFSVFAIIL